MKAWCGLCGLQCSTAHELIYHRCRHPSLKGAVLKPRPSPRITEGKISPAYPLPKFDQR